MNFCNSLPCKFLEILQFFQDAKIYERMKNFDSFYRICLLAAIITTRLLILKIFYGDESLISIFHFLCKAIVNLATISFIKKNFIMQLTLL